MYKKETQWYVARIAYVSERVAHENEGGDG